MSALNLTHLDDMCMAHGAHVACSGSGAAAAAGGAFDAAAAAEQRCALARVREDIVAGRMDDALAAAYALAPGALDDPRFQLDVRVHTLYELVHAARASAAAQGAYRSALDYARETLAPYAQEAFPEAYTIFLESLLVLIFPERADDVRVRRLRIADRVVSTLRARMGAKDSRLAFLVKYLITIQISAGARYVSAKHEQDAELIAAVASLVTPPVDEHDVALAASSVEQDAPASPDVASNTSWPTAAMSSPLSPTNGVHDAPDFAEHQALASVGGEAPALSWKMYPRPLPHGSFSRKFPDAHLLALRDRLPLTQEASLESMRYASGDLNAALLFELSLLQMKDAALMRMVQDYCSSRGLSSPKDAPASETHRAMRRLRELAASGTAMQLFEAAVELEPSLLGSSPSLHFRIGQAALVEHLRAGNYAGALEVARTKLGPLAHENPDLLPALRETTVLLAFPSALDDSMSSAMSDVPKSFLTSDSNSVSKRKRPSPEGETEHVECEHIGQGDVESNPDKASHDGAAQPMDVDEVPGAARIDRIRASVIDKSSAASLAGPIYRAVGQLGREPVLARLLASMLETHANWLAASGMATDQFGTLLGITDLLRPEDVEPGAAGMDGDSAGAGGREASGAGDAPDAEDEDSALMAKIITLRDVLYISRAEAMTILDQYPPNTDVTAIIEARMPG